MITAIIFDFHLFIEQIFMGLCYTESINHIYLKGILVFSESNILFIHVFKAPLLGHCTMMFQIILHNTHIRTLYKYN